MLVRVAEPGRPAFQLRKGEEGLSVFDLEAVSPPLTDGEILASFRAGSILLTRSLVEIEAKGLRVVPTPGALPLPERLREAQAELCPGPGMSRPHFKLALKELESDVNDL
jgi:hypothetical protein